MFKMVQQKYFNLLVSLVYSCALVTNGLEIFNPTAPSSPRNSLTCLDHVKDEHQMTIENFATFIESKEIPSDDYNEWIRIVVLESMKLCQEGDKICEGGVFSGVVHGMRSAISMRDGKDFEEMMIDFISEYSDDKSKKLLHDVIEIVESINPVSGFTEEHLDEIETLLKTFQAVSVSSQKLQNTLNLGLVGAKEWKNIFQNESHELNNVSTSQCKEKRHMRRDGTETSIVQKVFSELIMLNFLGAAYAAFDVEQGSNNPEDYLYNTETAAMISFISASLPVITTNVE